MDDRDVFSFHLRRVSLLGAPRALFGRPWPPGLGHTESFFTMQLGESVLSPRRYGFLDMATLCWWRDEAALEEHLRSPRGRALGDGWHVQLRLYRRWGRIRELDDAAVHTDAAASTTPVVAITLARLKLTETQRFTRFGKPVERQVRDHPGKTLALAAMRPLATFCTFSIWRDERAMVGMVQGRDEATDGPDHRVAMCERARRDFHHEFTTMRLVPLREVGSWRGASGYTRPSTSAWAPSSLPGRPRPGPGEGSCT